MPREGHPETPGADGLPGKRSRPANVLVVSSNYVECRRLARQLRELGCLAQTSEHAPDALHRMRLAIQDGMPFSSVIADEGLTGVDAVSFAHLVRKEPELENVQLLLLARRPKPDFEHYKEAGYTGQVDLRVDGALLARPLQESDPAPSETRRPAADPGDPSETSILVVEDNTINMFVTCEMFKRLGHHADGVEDGEQAVEAVKRTHYDLVFMDCQMPGVDGYEATRQIRAWEAEDPARGWVPIVALTAHAMKGDRDRCIDAGMDDYMTKPIETEMLANMIAKWTHLQGRRATRADRPGAQDSTRANEFRSQ